MESYSVRYLPFVRGIHRSPVPSGSGLASRDVIIVDEIITTTISLFMLPVVQIRYQWLGTVLQYPQCVIYGDAAVLHLAIDIFQLVA